jgi:hypothetical protein
MGKRERGNRADGQRCRGTKETDHVGFGSKENRSSPTPEMGQGQSLAEESRLNIRFPYRKCPPIRSGEAGLFVCRVSSLRELGSYPKEDRSMAMWQSVCSFFEALDSLG